MRILWIPHARWATPQRARLFCGELAKRHTVHVTDWQADFTTLRDFVSRRYVRNFTYYRWSDGPITVHHIPRVAPAIFAPPLTRLNSRIYAHWLRRIIQRERIDVVVGSYVAPLPRGVRVVFDLADDNVGYWRVYGRFQWFAEQIAATEADYLDHAAAIVTVSSVLQERVLQRGCRYPPTVIPNGVALREYAIDRPRPLRVDGPLIGLIGNHDKPSELRKVLLAAETLRNTGAHVAIVGRGSALPVATAIIRERGLDNVSVVGFVPPEQVAAYFAATDVGVCPYAKNPASDASSPMRLIAHAAAGSSVVCTRLEEVRRMAFSNVCLVDDSAEALADGIRTALGMPRHCPAQMRDYDLPRLAARFEAVLRGDSDAGERARAAV